MNRIIQQLMLTGGGGLTVTTATPFAVLITGGISLAHDNIETDEVALCTIMVTADWRYTIPHVICHEHWLRQDLNWHVPWGRRACIDLWERWADFIAFASTIAEAQAVEEYAVAYLLRSARSLLYRHFYAYQNNITCWPEEWKAWAHGPIGPQEYKKQIEQKVAYG